VSDRVGEGKSTETVVEGNDPHRGHRRVCEGGVCDIKFYLFIYLQFSLSLLFSSLSSFTNIYYT